LSTISAAIVRKYVKNVFGTLLANTKCGIFPRMCPRICQERGFKRVMLFLKKILFMSMFVVCFSMTAMAQRDDNQNRPPKNPDQPVIIPKEKDRPKPERPKDDNKNNGDRPKKPRDEYYES
jgi:hypothetical protein